MAVAAGVRGGSRTVPLALLGDERLARLAAAGHERAFAVVYGRYHQALYRYCRSILRHDADAQDALQSTFAAAFAALARGRPDAPIRPWLFRIAHNEAVSVLRRRRPTAELSLASESCSPSVEDQVAERAELAALVHDLRRLTDRQRSALLMRELSGLSHEEIALALGTSVGAAKQMIYEARRSLFEFAEGRAMACDEIRVAISDADRRAQRSRRIRAHLRGCSACSAFAAGIAARRADLRALAPALPMTTSAGLLGRVVAASPGHGAGAGGAGLATVAAGKTAGAALTANALAGVAVLASATVGVTIGVGRLTQAGEAGTASPPVAAARVRAASPPVLGRPHGNGDDPKGGETAATRARPTTSVSAMGAPVSATSGGRASSGAAVAAGAARRMSTEAPRPTHRYGPVGQHGKALGHAKRGAGAQHGKALGHAKHGAGAQHGKALGHARHDTNSANAHPGHGPPAWAGPGRPVSAGSGRHAAASGRSSAAGSASPPAKNRSRS